MKFDAEFLKKNLFWVLLVVSLPLIAIACVMLGPAVGGIIAGEEKTINDKLKSVQDKSKNVKTQADVAAAEERAKKSKEQETVVWKEAYQNQKKLMTWPEEYEAHFHYQTGFFAKNAGTSEAIEADRKGGEALAAAAEEAPSADKYAIHKITGIIDGIHPDWIEVKVDKKKVEKKDDKKTDEKKQADGPAEIVRIYNTKRAKVKFADPEPNKKYFFNSLKAGDRVTVNYEIGKYFGDALTADEIDKYKETYKSQIAPILKQVEPVDTKGDGLVELGDWLYSEKELPLPTDKFLTFLPGDLIPDPDNYKEIWIAQEDLWVQKELFRLVAQANDYVAKFDGEKLSDDAKVRRDKFTNPYWELMTEFDKSSGQFKLTMKNRLPQTQPANVQFSITMKVKEKDADGMVVEKEVPFLFAVQGGSLVSKASRAWTKAAPEGSVDILAVRQVLTWDNVAVKRIEQVCIGSGKRPTGALEGAVGVGPGVPGPAVGNPALAGSTTAQSSRTFAKELLSFFKLKKTDAPVAPGPIGIPQGGVGKANDDGSISKNGFDYKRYTDVTPQARRLPVGMVLVIDQNHLTRVLTSFSNSKLRFLTTQVLLNRYPKNIAPLKLTAKTPGTGPNPFPGGFGKGGMPFIPGYKSPPIGGGIPGQGGLDSTAGEPAESYELLEVVIYGTVSMYERFPPRPSGGDEAEGN